MRLVKGVLATAGSVIALIALCYLVATAHWLLVLTAFGICAFGVAHLRRHGEQTELAELKIEKKRRSQSATVELYAPQIQTPLVTKRVVNDGLDVLFADLAKTQPNMITAELPKPAAKPVPQPVNVVSIPADSFERKLKKSSDHNIYQFPMHQLSRPAEAQDS